MAHPQICLLFNVYHMWTIWTILGIPSSHFTAGVNWVFSDFGAPSPVAKQLGFQIREFPREDCCSIELLND
jgi:hypothetical protein